MPRLHQRNLLRATSCAQLDACCPQQVACCTQLVARNKLRWCKRGISVCIMRTLKLLPKPPCLRDEVKELNAQKQKNTRLKLKLSRRNCVFFNFWQPALMGLSLYWQPAIVNSLSSSSSTKTPFPGLLRVYSNSYCTSVNKLLLPKFIAPCTSVASYTVHRLLFPRPLYGGSIIK